MMISNLISNTCIKLNFSEKKKGPFHCADTVSSYSVDRFWWKFCIGGAYACVTTFRLSSHSF